MTDDSPLSTLELWTRDDERIQLGEVLRDRPTLLVAVRYYGCLPCQHYLVEVEQHRGALADRGVQVVAVGVAADFQADHLAREHAIGFPLLLDPEQQLYQALEIPRLRWPDLLRPSIWRIYVPLFLRRHVTRRVTGPRQGRPTGDPVQLPGLAIIDADGRIAYLHRGRRLGDYPPIEEVLDTVEKVLAT